MKNIAILGSTGSIGTQTLDIVRRFPSKFRVVGLTTNVNVDLLKEQVEEFKPEAVAVMDDEAAKKLELDIPVYTGMEGLIKISTMQNMHTLVTSVVGSVGLEPTLAAIKAKKTIALANKETLVTAGEIVMREAKENGVEIIPVDSEHSAIFQCLSGQKHTDIRKLLITCSGGSFRGKKAEELQDVTVKEALAHPTWNMGGKITIDSATLMNKGFEVIEAMWLYDMPLDNIEVVVHPQSIIHSMVEFDDSNILAQLGSHDMRLPIQYALNFPEKRESAGLPSLDFTKLRELTFEQPDLETFPCLQYAFEAGQTKGTMPAVVNAANEVAVSIFLKGGCKFMDIPGTIRKVMDAHELIKNPDLNQILEADTWARKKAEELLR